MADSPPLLIIARAATKRLEEANQELLIPAPATYCEAKPCLPESPCQHSHECYGSPASGSIPKDIDDFPGPEDFGVPPSGEGK